MFVFIVGITNYIWECLVIFECLWSGWQALFCIITVNLLSNKLALGVFSSMGNNQSRTLVYVDLRIWNMSIICNLKPKENVSFKWNVCILFSPPFRKKRENICPLTVIKYLSTNCNKIHDIKWKTYISTNFQLHPTLRTFFFQMIKGRLFCQSCIFFQITETYFKDVCPNYNCILTKHHLLTYE